MCSTSRKVCGIRVCVLCVWVVKWKRQHVPRFICGEKKASTAKFHRSKLYSSKWFRHCRCHNTFLHISEIENCCAPFLASKQYRSPPKHLRQKPHRFVGRAFAYILSFLYAIQVAKPFTKLLERLPRILCTSFVYQIQKVSKTTEQIRDTHRGTRRERERLNRTWGYMIVFCCLVFLCV